MNPLRFPLVDDRRAPRLNQEGSMLGSYQNTAPQRTTQNPQKPLGCSSEHGRPHVSILRFHSFAGGPTLQRNHSGGAPRVLGLPLQLPGVGRPLEKVCSKHVVTNGCRMAVAFGASAEYVALDRLIIQLLTPSSRAPLKSCRTILKKILPVDGWFVFLADDFFSGRPCDMQGCEHM